MNKNLLTVKDYSVQLEVLSTEKLIKLLHISKDNIIDLKRELTEVEEYSERIEVILNKRGE